MHPNTNIFGNRRKRNDNFKPAWLVKTHWDCYVPNHFGEQDTTIEEFQTEYFASLAIKERLDHGRDGVKGNAIHCELLDPITGKNSFISRESTNKGLRQDRTMHNLRELVFAGHWDQENIQRRGINFGQGILQDLFIDRTGVMDHAYFVKEITKREQMIVATVIQWLGTNCGWCFLNECLNKCGYKIVKSQ